MSDSVRIITKTSQDAFTDALEELGHDEFLEGVSIDHGHYFAVVRTLDRTAIDKLKEDLDQYRKLADEVYETLESDAPAKQKVAQLCFTMMGAEDDGLVGPHVGTIEVNNTPESTQ